MSTAPAAMTYDSLVADTIGYCERKNDITFAAQVPSLIAMAENRLASEVRGLGLLQVVTGTLNGNQLAKPARWRETKSFAITVPTSGVQYLQARSYQYCRAFNPTGATGVPRYYSDEDYEHWFIAPTPAGSYQIEIQYHERPEPLSAANQTNWTTQYAPQLILYGVLIESLVWLKNTERLAQIQPLFDRALMMVAKEDQGRLDPDAASVRK